MRVGILALLLLSTAAAAGCYQRPSVPRENPLRCSPAQAADEGECPVGFRCIASGVCALIDCRKDDDCAQGLVCTERTGCDLPGPDGGGDGGGEGGLGGTDGGQGGLLPGGTDALNPPVPDAPAGIDLLPALDASGGGS